MPRPLLACAPCKGGRLGGTGPLLTADGREQSPAGRSVLTASRARKCVPDQPLPSRVVPCLLVCPHAQSTRGPVLAPACWKHTMAHDPDAAEAAVPSKASRAETL